MWISIEFTVLYKQKMWVRKEMAKPANDTQDGASKSHVHRGCPHKWIGVQQNSKTFQLLEGTFYNDYSINLRESPLTLECENRN